MLSDDQKKQGVGIKLPGGALPGLGGNPSAGSLPGLGGRPAGALPGLGARPGAGALPGMKPAGGALPGMKPGAALSPSAPTAAQARVVPAFLQPKQPQAASKQQTHDARAAALEAEQRIMDALVQTANQDSPLMDSRAKKTVLYGGIIAGVIGISIGMAFGLGLTGRQQKNSTIRDALIINYELSKAGKVVNEIQTLLSTAVAKANKREFDSTHIGYLKNSMAGNPMSQNLLSERNFKSFDPAAVEMLFNYYRQWDKLYALLKEHIRATGYDLKQLQASGAAAQKIDEVNYGMVFKRDKEQDNKFVANVVVLGITEGKQTQVQLDTSTFGSERELYNPALDDSALAKSPAKYVVEVSPDAKKGLLANATQSHFEKYLNRLKDLSTLVTSMAQVQKDVAEMISHITSQSPSFGVDPNPEDGLQEYMQQAKSPVTEEPAKK